MDSMKNGISQMNCKEIYISALALAFSTLIICMPVSAGQVETGKSSMQDVKKEVGEAADAIKRYSVDQRDAAISKAQAVMDALDDKIDKLEESIHKNWEKMDQATRRHAQAALDNLKMQRKKMAESYSALKHSSAGAWEQVKKGFADSYEDLHGAWQRAKGEFENEK